MEDSELDKLVNEAQQDAAGVANSTQGPVLSNEDGLEFETLEVGGVITDKYGNFWQVPGDNVEDLDDLYSGDIYKIPEEMSKVFHVQMIRKDQMNEYSMRHFVPVLQEELGIPKELIKDMGNPLDRYHCVGDAIMVKIPHVINDRIQARKTAEVQKRLMQLEPTEEMMKKAGLPYAPKSFTEHRIGHEVVNPANRPILRANTDGKGEL